MTLTKGQGHRSRSNVQKMAKMGHISDVISPTDFILGTKVQPIKMHSMTQVPMTLTFGQGQKSRSNFPNISTTDFIAAFCDSFGRCPLVKACICYFVIRLKAINCKISLCHF